MRAGDILRQKTIKIYQQDPRNYSEISPGRDKAFVSLLLGLEDFQLFNAQGEPVGTSLDVEAALNKLGWWSESQITNYLGRSGKRSMDKIRERAAEKRSELWDEPHTDPLDLVKSS